MQNEKTSKTEITKWLRELRDAIPKSTDVITPRTLDIWASRLVQIPRDVLAAAALLLIERHTFFPSLKEILDVCREITYEGRIPNAGEALEELLGAARRVGYCQPCPEFSHPAVGKALGAIGGWRYFCSSENFMSDRARFFDVYEKLREQAYREETMPEFTKEVAAKYLKQIEARAAPQISGGERARLSSGEGVRPNKPGKPRSPSQPRNVVPIRPKVLGEHMTEEQWRARKEGVKEKLR